ncbi:uncharacterized protein EI90DRAFT_3048122 [Cantharellus anzutake]|uniref:uncharacterized protein n=1 Tax=Cantharellus anzutake TaxID=1750568 RepID=UPI0019067CCA|nr:uncharacterized protein EI90DRAFT_3048122 [Cantharellus anzutake]KAF8335381.1 hypothetical protein EI90DRAFT_3048122 [Cantharellus anzutake]
MSHILAENLTAEALFGLKGKVVLVTGGGTGIGLMMAKGLAVNGAKTYIGSRRKNVIESAAESHGKGLAGRIIPIDLDVTSKESILNAVEVIRSENDGRLDVLINNAGQVGPKTLWFGDPSAPQRKDAETLGRALFDHESFEDWQQLFSINLASIYFVTTAFLGLLDKGSKVGGDWSASVVNITSISGSYKMAQNHFAYNASKAAGDHLNVMLATEFAAKGLKIRGTYRRLSKRLVRSLMELYSECYRAGLIRDGNDRR